MQKMLSDELIESAFKTWPQAAYDASAESIINDLKSRRDQLPELARKFYEQIATKVDVNGTNDDDRFVIDRLSPDQLRVRVYELSKGGKNSRLVYRKTNLTFGLCVGWRRDSQNVTKYQSHCEECIGIHSVCPENDVTVPLGPQAATLMGSKKPRRGLSILHSSQL